MRKSFIHSRHFIAIAFISLFTYLIITSVRLSDDVFVPAKHEPQISEWEAYLADRRQRNAKAQALSYEDLLTLGFSNLESRQLDDAVEAFEMAKSIFPTRLEPRIQLCYLFLKMCEKDGSFCKLGKREIYYAMHHAEGSDPASKTYLNELVRYTSLEEIVELEEAVAMNEIF